MPMEINPSSDHASIWTAVIDIHLPKEICSKIGQNRLLIIPRPMARKGSGKEKDKENETNEEKGKGKGARGRGGRGGRAKGKGKGRQDSPEDIEATDSAAKAKTPSSGIPFLSKSYDIFRRYIPVSLSICMFFLSYSS